MELDFYAPQQWQSPGLLGQYDGPGASLWGPRSPEDVPFDCCRTAPGADGRSILSLQPFPFAHVIVAVACGSDHTLALNEDGAVCSWGFDGPWDDGSWGRLGHGPLWVENAADNSIYAPRVIEETRATPMKAISAGSEHCLSLSRGGRLYAWGVGFHGQLGQTPPPHELDGTRTWPRPQAVGAAGLVGVEGEAVAAGTSHSLLLSTTGRARSTPSAPTTAAGSGSPSTRRSTSPPPRASRRSMPPRAAWCRCRRGPRRASR